MSSTPTSPTTGSNKRSGWFGCGAVLVALLALGGISAVIQSLTSGPETVIMPNFRGQACEAATNKLNEMLDKHGVENTVTFHGMNPGCGKNVVFRTTPAAGAEVTSTKDNRAAVAWDVIDRNAFDFYKANKKMPDLIGKALVRDFESSIDAMFMTEVRDDSLVQIQSDGSFYIAAESRVTRTEPAPGARLRMGQHITVYTQTQRGKYISGDVGKGGSNSGGGSHLNFYACKRFFFVRACIT